MSLTTSEDLDRDFVALPGIRNRIRGGVRRRLCDRHGKKLRTLHLPAGARGVWLLGGTAEGRTGDVLVRLDGDGGHRSSGGGTHCLFRSRARDEAVVVGMVVGRSASRDVCPGLSAQGIFYSLKCRNAVSAKRESGQGEMKPNEV